MAKQLDTKSEKSDSTIQLSRVRETSKGLKDSKARRDSDFTRTRNKREDDIENIASEANLKVSRINLKKSRVQERKTIINMGEIVYSLYAVDIYLLIGLDGRLAIFNTEN
jgi:hypothetical protein